MNLNIYVAKSGFSSRRGADELIKSGKVRVNDKIVLEPWFRVRKDDRVTVAGKMIGLQSQVYIIFNKPVGVTTTLKDKFADRKIIDFIPKKMGRVYPVGRLDKMSRGLILLTNDGELCHRMTHPKFELEKEYRVVVEGFVDPKAIDKLKNGVQDGNDFLNVRKARLCQSGPKRSVVDLVVTEGKKRHIRRLFDSIGIAVADLKRTRIGGLEIGDLKEGEFKIMDKEAVYRLVLGMKNIES